MILLLCVVLNRWLNGIDLTGTLPTELGLMTGLTSLCAHLPLTWLVCAACAPGGICAHHAAGPVMAAHERNGHIAVCSAVACWLRRMGSW